LIPFGQLLGTHPLAGENYFDTVLAVAQASERAGLDAIFYSDHVQMQRHSIGVRGLRLLARRLNSIHLLRSLSVHLAHWAYHLSKRYDQNPRHTLHVLECFTTLGAIAAATERIRLGALVAGVPYRNPALLAKINITLDVISHGRAIIGLGASWHEEEFRSHGWRFPPVKERMEGLEDAVHIIEAMTTQRRASYRGKHYTIDDALTHPLPVQRPRPPLLIGGSGERQTLRLVAQYADYCNLFGDPATVAHKLGVLQNHCAAVGRPYEAIVPSNFVSILIAENGRELARKRRQYRPWLGYGMSGTPAQIVDALQKFVDVGIRYIIFNLPDAHTLDPIYLLAETVMPAFAGQPMSAGQVEKQSVP